MIMVMDNYTDPQPWDDPEDMTEAIMLMKRRTRGSVADEYLLGKKHVVQIMYWKSETEPESIYIIEEE